MVDSDDSIDVRFCYWTSVMSSGDAELLSVTIGKALSGVLRGMEHVVGSVVLT